MSCAGSHWGEEQDSQRSVSDDWSLSLSDMEDLLTPAPPHPSTSPMLHQPSYEETPSFQILPAKFCKTDPLVLQTIRLLQYQRQVAQLIARAQGGTGIDGGNLSACPPLPLKNQTLSVGQQSQTSRISYHLNAHHLQVAKINRSYLK